MTNDESRRLDQNLAAARDTFPRLWWSLYTGAVNSGFTDSQSMSLVQTWILAQGERTIRPNQAEERKSDEE